MALTPRGVPITCDGCGAFIEEVTNAARHPVPDDIAIANYGKAGLNYIVCPPRADSIQPCLDLARLAEELCDDVRCRIPGSDGTRCGTPAGTA